MTKTDTKLAVVILALVAASFVPLLYGLQLGSATSRITSLRTAELGGQPHLALFFRNRLHLLDASGQRVVRQGLAELALTEEPNDMDWVTTPDGQVQAWFFEDTAPRIVRCTLDATTRRLGGCAAVLTGPQLKTHGRSLAVHLAVDAAGQRVFVADAKGHRVQALGFDGKLLATSANVPLYFPNRLRLTGQGELVVADNDNRRLVWLDVRDAVPRFIPGRELRSGDHPQAARSRTKVTDVAWIADASGAPQTLWMLAVAQGQTDGQLLVYGPGLTPQVRATLGTSTDPLGVDRLGDAAVVVDYDGIDVYRVGRNGEFLGPFGDTTFRALLAAERAKVRQADWLVKGGWAGFALTLVIGFALAFKYGQKPQTAQAPVLGAAAATVDRSSFPPPAKVKIAPEPWFVRQMRFALWLGPVLVLGMLAVMGTLLSHEFAPLLQGKSGFGLGVMVGALLLVTGYGVHRAIRFTGRWLVVTPDELRVVDNGRIVAASPLAHVQVSPVALLIGHTLLAYRQAAGLGHSGAKWIYSQDQITEHLFSRLLPTQSVSPGRLVWLMLQRLPRLQKLALAAGVLIVLVMQVLTVTGVSLRNLW